MGRYTQLRGSRCILCEQSRAHGVRHDAHAGSTVGTCTARDSTGAHTDTHVAGGRRRGEGNGKQKTSVNVAPCTTVVVRSLQLQGRRGSVPRRCGGGTAFAVERWQGYKLQAAGWKPHTVT
jgi:hypothetical protein